MDSNCDGTIDSDAEFTTYFHDGDGDGFGHGMIDRGRGERREGGYWHGSRSFCGEPEADYVLEKHFFGVQKINLLFVSFALYRFKGFHPFALHTSG